MTPLEEIRAREELRLREQAENDRARRQAAATGKSVTFIAHDGCEVTVTPNGTVFHNAADWW